jgi:4-diphosphocytidyl-2-C-methyl-D-erythritol kinase
MLLFPNAKINIGLNILRKRNDGYHDIETIFYPVGLKDGLEFVENGFGKVNFTSTGLSLELEREENIVVKAYRMLADHFSLPGIDIHLHKVIPFNAGLGGGSSDAAYMLKGLNEYFKLKLSNETLSQFAVQLGADCAIFIENKPSLATGIGDVLEEIEIDLKGYHLLIVKPWFGVVTKEAYSSVVPETPETSLRESLRLNPENWTGLIKNDFEPVVFKKYPEISAIKKTLIEHGAVYASMSGSGSSVFGLFKSNPKMTARNFHKGYFIRNEKL